MFAARYVCHKLPAATLRNTLPVASSLLAAVFRVIENLYRCKKKVLGRGLYGKVYLVRDVSTGEEYEEKESQDAQINNDRYRTMRRLTHISNIYLSGTLLGTHLPFPLSFSEHTDSKKRLEQAVKRRRRILIGSHRWGYRVHLWRWTFSCDEVYSKEKYTCLVRGGI